MPVRRERGMQSDCACVESPLPFVPRATPSATRGGPEGRGSAVFRGIPCENPRRLLTPSPDHAPACAKQETATEEERATDERLVRMMETRMAILMDRAPTTERERLLKYWPKAGKEAKKTSLRIEGKKVKVASVKQDPRKAQGPVSHSVGAETAVSPVVNA
eukprot:42047-Prorocentrum_minimum.AAC.1